MSRYLTIIIIVLGIVIAAALVAEMSRFHLIGSSSAIDRSIVSLVPAVLLYVPLVIMVLKRKVLTRGHPAALVVILVYGLDLCLCIAMVGSLTVQKHLADRAGGMTKEMMVEAAGLAVPVECLSQWRSDRIQRTNDVRWHGTVLALAIVGVCIAKIQACHRARMK